MRKIKYLLILLSLTCFFISCSSDDENEEARTEKELNEKGSSATTSEDGNVSYGDRLVEIDDKNFYLDNIKYSIVDDHLMVSGYDEEGISDTVMIVPKISYKGVDYDVLGIGKLAFDCCSKITCINIPHSITYIEPNAFDRCRKLSSVNISDLEAYCIIDFKDHSSSPFINMGTHLFLNGTEITELVIPDNTTRINSWAFNCLESLKSVTIHDKITSIGKGAFRRCGLTSVYISDLEAWCKIDFGDTNSNPIRSYECHLILNGTEITDLVIPNSITLLKDYAFADCSYIESISIPNTVTSIGKYVFRDCIGITSVNIPNSVNTIGDGAFGDCKGLSTLNIPQSVISIGQFAFSGCSGLTSLTVPQSVISIGQFAFSSCYSLTSVTLVNGVINIGAEAFQGCTNLKSITIPKSVTVISNGAFNGCENLSDVYISDLEAWCKIDFGDTNSNPLRSHEGHLILNGTEITDLIIPNSVTTIKKYTFQGCSGFSSSLVIPNTVTTIEEGAFSYCTGINSITIGNGVTDIRQGAFSGCDNLTSLTFHCKTVGRWFANNSIKEVVFGDEVETVGESALSGCENLNTITFGKNVKIIHTKAFDWCRDLGQIYCLCTNPPRFDGNNHFYYVYYDSDNSVYSKATLYVPKGTKSVYQSVAHWRDFKNIVEI